MIESLVVIAILAALLLPALSRAKQQACRELPAGTLMQFVADRKLQEITL